MTFTFFISLLVILAGCVSLITEAVKKCYSELKVKYSANALVLTISVIVGAGGTILAYLFMGIAFTLPNILAILLMIIAIWVGAMIGYDKVIQMIEQIKTLKLK